MVRCQPLAMTPRTPPPSTDPAHTFTTRSKTLWKTSDQMIKEAKTRLAEKAPQVVRAVRPPPAVTSLPLLRSAPPPTVSPATIDSFEELTRDQTNVRSMDYMEVRGVDLPTVESMDRSSVRSVDGVAEPTQRQAPTLPPAPDQTSVTSWNDLVKLVKPFIGWIIFLLFIVISQLAQ